MSRRVPIATVAVVAMACALGAAAPGAASELRLETVRVEPSAIVVDLMASQLRTVGSFDVVVRFDPAMVSAPVRENGALASGGMSLDHASDPGTYRLAILVPRGVTGDGALARLRFPIRAAQNSVDLTLDARLTDLAGAPLDVRVRSARVDLPRPEAGEDAPAEQTADAGRDGPEPRDAEPNEASAEAAKSADPEPPPAASEAATEKDGVRFDRDGRPEDPVRRAEDLAARAAGYRLQVRFDPPEALADGSSTPMRAVVRGWRSTEALSLSPEDVRLAGKALRVERIESGEDGLTAALRIDAEALPAWLELEAFGLLERHRVPLHPRADVDFDGSGSADSRDYTRLVERFGARRGSDRYDERFDLVRDGVIDEADVDAFRFNMIESERARRLERLERAAREDADVATSRVDAEAEAR